MGKRQMASAPEPNADGSAPTEPLVSDKYYRRLLYSSVFSVSLVAILPLVVMTVVNYYQYQDAFHVESLRPTTRFISNAKLSLEAFLSERISALSLVIQTESPEDLQDPQKLKILLARMKRAFGGFIDLGLIDSTGMQVSYAGPYDLQGRDYREQDWFHEVGLRGVFISDLFGGLPHFAIAVSFDTHTAASFVLRATIDTEKIVRQIRALAMTPSNDAFLINREGILQTPSRFYGRALEPCPLIVPPVSTRAEVLEIQDEEGCPVPGFEMDRCDPIDRNFVAYPVTWRNDPDVSVLQGRRVRLRFRMRSTKLYAFQFTGAGEVEDYRRSVHV